jgi:FixJ family two-component response regulator
MYQIEPVSATSDNLGILKTKVVVCVHQQVGCLLLHLVLPILGGYEMLKNLMDTEQQVFVLKMCALGQQSACSDGNLIW